MALAALLLLVTVLAYLPVFRAGFIWDDDCYVTGNSTLLKADGLRRIWCHPSATAQYYPLVHTSFWIEHRLWGLNPIGYHLDGVLLHALNAILVWLMLRRLSILGAGLTAFIFALHPVQVESVAWITERKNLLSGAFYLGALMTFNHFFGMEKTSNAGKRKWKYYWIGLVLYACALLSKTVTCSLPAIVWLLIWWRKEKVKWTDILPLIPLFVLGAAMGLTTVWLEKHQVGASGSYWQFSWIERCLIAGRAFWFYLGKLIWPWKLSFIYPRWQISAAAVGQFAFPIAALFVGVIMWTLRKRMGKGALTALLIFVATLFPALGFFDIYPMRFTFVADHYQYLASIAPLGLAGVMLVNAGNHMPNRKPWLKAVVCAGLVLALGTLTWNQARVYHDLNSLWTDTLNKNPNCALAHNNLGAIFLKQGQANDAIAHWQRAIEVDPNFDDPYNNLGYALFTLGRMDEAFTCLQKAVQINPNFAGAHFNLGLAFFKAGEIEEAIAHWQKSVVLKPDFVASHSNLGSALFMAGRHDEAILQWQKTIQLDPDNALAYNNLGLVFLKMGRLDKALAHWQRAVEIRPENLDARNNLAWLLATCPNPAFRNGVTAVALAEKSNHIAGNQNPMVLATLAAAYAEVGQYSNATEAGRFALQLATDQNKNALVGRLRKELELFRAGLPFRDNSCIK
jgi:protein O-mannosyl-transferase